MTTIIRPRPRVLPHKDTPVPEAISTTADVAELLQRSNHATAFAGWTVTTIAMGLVIQADTLRSIGSFTVTLVLIGLLVPILFATTRTAFLLAGAGRAITAVGGDSEPTGAVAGTLSHSDPLTGAHPQPPHIPQEITTQQALDRLRSVVASVQFRNARTRRALRWAYGSGAAFLIWSLAVTLSASS